MTQFLKNSKDIVQWLQHYGIREYTLVEDEQYGYVVHVNYDVDLKNRQLNSIPVKFGTVSGFFNVRGNNLTEIDFSPTDILSTFDCSMNQIKSLIGCPSYALSYLCQANCLTSLEGAPEDVQEVFNCSFNQLTSLQYAPTGVEDFICKKNLLKNLEYAPEIVEGFFDCRDNLLENLLFCPPSVKGEFFCENNAMLGATQQITDFSEIFEIHKQTKLAYDEKMVLKKLVGTDTGEHKLEKFKI